MPSLVIPGTIDTTDPVRVVDSHYWVMHNPNGGFYGYWVNAYTEAMRDYLLLYGYTVEQEVEEAHYEARIRVTWDVPALPSGCRIDLPWTGGPAGGAALGFSLEYQAHRPANGPWVNQAVARTFFNLSDSLSAEGERFHFGFVNQSLGLSPVDDSVAYSGHRALAWSDYAPEQPHYWNVWEVGVGGWNYIDFPRSVFDPLKSAMEAGGDTVQYVSSPAFSTSGDEWFTLTKWDWLVEWVEYTPNPTPGGGGARMERVSVQGVEVMAWVAPDPNNTQQSAICIGVNRALWGARGTPSAPGTGQGWEVYRAATGTAGTGLGLVALPNGVLVLSYTEPEGNAVYRTNAAMGERWAWSGETATGYGVDGYNGGVDYAGAYRVHT